MPRPLATGVAIVFALAVLAGCGAGPQQGPATPAQAADSAGVPSPASPTPSASIPPTESPTPTPAAGPASESPVPEAPSLASDGRPQMAWLTIPALGLVDLPVSPHQGTPDDAQGTRIQDGGSAASPYGTGGLVGAGGVGNYLIAAHRTSSTKAFAQLPGLPEGAEVYVDTEDHRYTYRIVETRITSFRSAASLREQSAAVPGHPDATPSEAMLTLSTCRTPEDRAEGNYWSDQFGNPEHRIDKIGVLVAAAPIAQS